MCGLLPPTRFSTVVFANAASYVCVCVCVKPEREGGTHFSTVGGGGQIVKSVKRKVTLCRVGLPFTFHLSDAMYIPCIFERGVYCSYSAGFPGAFE